MRTDTKAVRDKLKTIGYPSPLVEYFETREDCAIYGDILIRSKIDDRKWCQDNANNTAILDELKSIGCTIMDMREKGGHCSVHFNDWGALQDYTGVDKIGVHHN